MAGTLGHRFNTPAMRERMQFHFDMEHHYGVNIHTSARFPSDQVVAPLFCNSSQALCALYGHAATTHKKTLAMSKVSGAYDNKSVTSLSDTQKSLQIIKCIRIIESIIKNQKAAPLYRSLTRCDDNYIIIMNQFLNQIDMKIHYGPSQAVDASQALSFEQRLSQALADTMSALDKLFHRTFLRHKNRQFISTIQNKNRRFSNKGSGQRKNYNNIRSKSNPNPIQTQSKPNPNPIQTQSKHDQFTSRLLSDFVSMVAQLSPVTVSKTSSRSSKKSHVNRSKTHGLKPNLSSFYKRKSLLKRLMVGVGMIYGCNGADEEMVEPKEPKMVEPKEPKTAEFFHMLRTAFPPEKNPFNDEVVSNIRPDLQVAIMRKSPNYNEYNAYYTQKFGNPYTVMHAFIDSLLNKLSKIIVQFDNQSILKDNVTHNRLYKYFVFFMSVFMLVGAEGDAEKSNAVAWVQQVYSGVMDSDAPNSTPKFIGADVSRESISNVYQFIGSLYKEYISDSTDEMIRSLMFKLKDGSHQLVESRRELFGRIIEANVNGNIQWWKRGNFHADMQYLLESSVRSSFLEIDPQENGAGMNGDSADGSIKFDGDM